MEKGAIVIVIVIAIIVIALVIGLVLWLVLRKDDDNGEDGGNGGGDDEDSEEDEEDEESEDEEDTTPPNNDLCKDYDKSIYTKCSTLLIDGYFFRNLEFKSKTLKDKVENRYFWNKSTNVDPNLQVGNSSSQLYSLIGNRITVNNRNQDNYLRADKDDLGWVFFWFGSLPDEEVEFVFYDGSNICFYDQFDQDRLYILRDQNGAFVEEVRTRDYHEGIINGSFPAYIEVLP